VATWWWLAITGSESLEVVDAKRPDMRPNTMPDAVQWRWATTINLRTVAPTSWLPWVATDTVIDT